MKIKRFGHEMNNIEIKDWRKNAKKQKFCRVDVLPHAWGKTSTPKG